MDLFDANGKKVREMIFDTQDNRPLWAFPFNAAIGKYTAVLTDVATNLSSKVEFELK